jgi:hypothetical protein
MINLTPVAYNERKDFVVWKNRFADEYNNSSQSRIGHILIRGIPPKVWKSSFKLKTPPYWIKNNNQIVGVVMCQQLVFNWFGNPHNVDVVTDVYVDPKHRNKGILRETLLMMRDKGFAPIVIDKLKLLDNARYYVSLGFKYATEWNDQELVILSPAAVIDPIIWKNIVPHNYVLEAA